MGIACALAAAGCVVLPEFEAEKDLLAFREAEKSAAIVLLPDSLTVERTYETGLETSWESREFPVPWPLNLENEMARVVKTGLAARAPSLRMIESAAAGPFVEAMPVEDCLAEDDARRDRWGRHGELSGLRGVWTDPRPVPGSTPVARRVEPDTLLVVSDLSPDGGGRLVCHAVDLRGIRGLGVDFAVWVHVASIEHRLDDRAAVTSAVVYERLVALRAGRVTLEEKRVESSNDAGSMLGASLLGTQGADDLTADRAARLSECLRTLAERVPVATARLFGYLDDAAVAHEKAAWRAEFEAAVAAARAAIAVEP